MNSSNLEASISGNRSDEAQLRGQGDSTVGVGLTF